MNNLLLKIFKKVLFSILEYYELSDFQIILIMVLMRRTPFINFTQIAIF